MRANLEDVLIRRARHNSPSFGTVSYELSGTFVLPANGPTFHFLDGGASDRTVYLPELMEAGGQQYIIANTGSSNSLNVVDADGVAVATLAFNDVGMFLSSATDWKHIHHSDQVIGAIAGLFSTPRIVTGATFTVSSTEISIAINRSAPVTTDGTLPSVASRNGRPVRIVDYSTSVTGHTITLTPNGAETIMRQATWTLVSNAASLAGVTLYPSTGLSGWYIAP